MTIMTDRTKEMNFPQKIFLTLHCLMFFYLLFSPLYLSRSFQYKYGYIIAYCTTVTIISWIFFGRCVFNDLENSNKYGSITTFFTEILGINVTRENESILNMTTYSIFFITFYYSPGTYHTYFTIFLFIVYKINKSLQKFYKTRKIKKYDNHI